MLSRAFKILVFTLMLSCGAVAPSDEKIKGISFVGPASKIDHADIIPSVQAGMNWACLMPFAFIEGNKPKIIREHEWQWWGEKKGGVRTCLRFFRKEHKKIMLKPQIWISRGAYTGNYVLQNEEEWKVWEEQYKEYILDYAQMAQEEKVELFCIGTELEKVIENRPKFWNALIKEVRNIYKGKLTYAANWDNYKNIPFWNELDYIGIDAYFPLSEKENPSEADLIKGWQGHKNEILAFSRKHHRKILFTEVGYRSVDFTAKEPWQGSMGRAPDEKEQKVAYEALFKTFWHEKSFKGLFIWKWFDKHDQLQGESYLKGYTPQRKPAEKVIKEWFSK